MNMRCEDNFKNPEVFDPDRWDPKFNLEKDNKNLYTYGFNPEIIFTDVIENGEINGGVQQIKKSNFTIPAPNIEFDNITILNYENKKIFSLSKSEMANLDNKQPPSLGLLDLINNLMSSLLSQLFR